MAVLSSSNRVLYITRQEDFSLDFTVRGTLFPNWATPGSSSQATSHMTLESTSANKIYIDWGDGTTNVYDFVYISAFVYRIRFSRNLQSSPPTSGSFPYDAPLHYYQDLGSATGTVDDNLDVRRIVSFSFDAPENVSSITTNLIRFFGTLPIGLGGLRGMNTLSIFNAYQLDSIPSSLYRSNVRNLTLSNIGPAYSEQIPPWIINSPVHTLNLSGNNYNDLDGSNMSQLHLMKDTLVSLTLNGNNLLDLPSSFAELNLLVLSINSNMFSTIPEVINEITSIENLNFLGGYSGGTRVESWGDISSLTELRSLTYVASYSGPMFTATIPSYFSNFLKLKNVGCHSVFWQTQSRCDSHIEEWYSLIAANASKETGNTAFRQMSFTYYVSAAPAYNLRPSGTYQQPTGYVQGVSNGTPVSPMEMIWVMVNQYGHTWTVKPL